MKKLYKPPKKPDPLFPRIFFPILYLVWKRPGTKRDKIVFTLWITVVPILLLIFAIIFIITNFYLNSLIDLIKIM